MSHQVLARKWRPRRFQDVVGQEHAIQALTNALETRRIHHAYLFTGTRGVGKTTLARILAKALNCVGPDGQGDITAAPCGVCAACTEIDAGRFVDLLEVDAATNTKVDEMRELLETAQYAPVAGRYKVYIIDEVHMLSKSAFNAMLKTLEEPPGHVEFILATTDPQKLPITVLSRCLQFNLRNLAPTAIAGHLAHILREEGIAFEAPALEAIGRAGEGSVRDALSLLDQAIAYGGGAVQAAPVAAMLGALDLGYLFTLLDHLAARDAPALLAEIDALATRSISFDATLKELAGMLVRLALIQHAGGNAVEGADADRWRALAAAFNPDDLQLCYQIAILGRRDLALAPDEQSGFTMTLLRMLGLMEPGGAGRADHASTVPPPRAATVASAPTAKAPMAETPRPEPSSTGVPPAPAPVGGIEDWAAFVASSGLSGMAGMLAKQSELAGFRNQVLELVVPAAQKHLADKRYAERLKADLAPRLGEALRVTVRIGDTRGDSLAASEGRARSAAQEAAEASVVDDPFVKSLVEDFGALIDRTAIRPVGSNHS